MRRTTFTAGALAALLFGLLAGCTDAGLYAAGAGGPSGPDRAELKGEVCVPVATGDAFPVKVLFALQGGAGMDPSVRGEIVSSVGDIINQYSSPAVSFAIEAHHSVATGLQGSFVRDSSLATALAKYASNTSEGGPVSHRAALKLAESLISGDMQTSCKGQVARTRYVVVLVMVSADDSCNNPVFNAGIDQTCNSYLPDSAQCTACELARVTQELKALARQYNAGQVSVQPLYIRPSVEVVAEYQARKIAEAGGTQLLETSPGASPSTVEAMLKAVSYASLDVGLKLKRFVMMNRNVAVRAGAQVVDSDGDGLSDDEEAVLHTDPTLRDTDGDGLGDGIEVKMGLDPLTQNILSGCNAALDTDGDRVYDCEERVLGTDACIADTDGDGLSDLVEFLSGTDPLIPEDLADSDRDGLSNIAEVEAHTDPQSADIAFQQERGYGYAITDAPPTADGRACYDFDIYNVSLMTTLQRPSPEGSGRVVPKGINDLYLYFQVGRDNDPRGTGIGKLTIQEVTFIAPSTRKPRGTLKLTDDDFVSGF
jgi:hypothetical protein